MTWRRHGATTIFGSPDPDGADQLPSRDPMPIRCGGGRSQYKALKVSTLNAILIDVAAYLEMDRADLAEALFRR
jgi:hypothetical protein